MRLISKVIEKRYTLELKDEFQKISEFVRKKSKARNKLIHASWQLCDTYPDDLIEITPKWVRYTKADFEAVLEISIEARNKLHDFVIKISHAVRE